MSRDVKPGGQMRETKEAGLKGRGDTPRNEGQAANDEKFQELQRLIEEILRQGLDLHQKGFLEEAEKLYLKILEADPNNPNANYFLGLIARQTDRNERALPLFIKAIEGNSNEPAYHADLGSVLHRLGRLEDAVAGYQNALVLKPDFPEVLSNKGVALKELGRLEEAVACFRSALEINQDFVKAHINLGNALLKMLRREEAEACYRTALAINPDFLDAHLGLGKALRKQGRQDEALVSYQHAVALMPNSPEAHNSLGTVFKELGRIEDAVESYQQALSLNPDFADVHSNLGVASLEMGQLDDAEAWQLKALEIDADCAEAHYNLGLLYLMAGRFREGWDEYHWRWRLDEYSNKPQIPVSEWDGSDIANKTILIWAEQGVGDEILFAGIIPDLIATGARVILESDPRLVPLYQRSFPGIECIARGELPASGRRYEDIDFQAPVGDLGGWFRPDMASFSTPCGFLKADPERTAQQRARYQERFPDKHLVGISWRSISMHTGGGRSLALEDWLPVLSHPRCAFVNLQYGDVAEELDVLERDHGIDVLVDPDIDPFGDIDGLSSQIAAMDSVISIDNITLLLAGALGVSTWALLMSPPDWRWLLDRDDSPWYPEMRLFRQEKTKDWTGVIDRMARALNGRFEN